MKSGQDLSKYCWLRYCDFTDTLEDSEGYLQIQNEKNNYLILYNYCYKKVPFKNLLLCIRLQKNKESLILYIEIWVYVYSRHSDLSTLSLGPEDVEITSVDCICTWK